MAKGFVSKHPWMTFFLALAGLGAAQVIFARKQTASPLPAEPPAPSPGDGSPVSMGEGLVGPAHALGQDDNQAQMAPAPVGFFMPSPRFAPTPQVMPRTPLPPMAAGFSPRRAASSAGALHMQRRSYSERHPLGRFEG
jgi:hypothetical protein